MNSEVYGILWGNGKMKSEGGRVLKGRSLCGEGCRVGGSCRKRRGILHRARRGVEDREWGA